MLSAAAAAAAAATFAIVITATAAPIAVIADVNAYQLVPCRRGKSPAQITAQGRQIRGGNGAAGWVLWLQRMLPLTAAAAKAAGMLQALPRAQDEHVATAGVA